MPELSRRPCKVIVRKVGSSLKGKLAFGATLLIGLMSLVIYLYVPAKQEREYGQALADKAASLVEMTASLVRPSLEFDDELEAIELMAKATGIHGIVYAVAYDADFVPFASSALDRAHRADFKRVDEEVSLESSVHRVSASVTGEDGEYLGTVYLGISLETLRTQVAQSRREIALLSLVLFLIGIIGVYWVSSLVTGPLGKILGATRAIAEGDLSRRAPESGSDEVFFLARSFNQMVEKLGAAQEDLEALNRSLEERVADRTAELEEEMAQRQRVEESQILLAAAVEQAAEIHIITTPEGIVEYANPAFEHATGYRSHEILGRHFSNLLSPDNPPVVVSRLEETMGSGEGWAGQVLKLKKNGEVYTERTAISPVRDGLGKLIRFISVGHDITREVALEDQLRQSQKMEAVGRLAGGIAHDFNNLLTTISGYSELLLSSMDDPDSLLELTEIKRAADRAAALTQQLLAFSRRQVLRPEPLDPGLVIQEMMGMLRRLLGEDVTLRLELDPDRPLVKVDKTQLEQVVMNLTLNSRDAMPEGGEITLRVQRTPGFEHSEPGFGRVTISVEDTGEGMDEATLAQIFEPFFTTKELGKGTGLGLSTVYGIVQQSGGEITAWSEEGQGTRIEVHLDETTGHVDFKAEETRELTDLGSLTVLVVEDEPMVRGLVRRQLEGAGLKVLVACDAEEALSVADAHEGTIHGMISDVIMPGMNGADLAETMVQRRQDLRVLLMSGYTDRVPVRQDGKVSGFPLLNKPFSQEELAHALEQVLEGCSQLAG